MSKRGKKKENECPMCGGKSFTATAFVSDGVDSVGDVCDICGYVVTESIEPVEPEEENE